MISHGRPLRIRFTVVPTIKFDIAGTSPLRVEAVKDLRYLTSLGLKDAKDIIVSMKQEGAETPQKVVVEITNPETIAHFLASRLEDILSERHGTDPKVLKGDWVRIEGMVVDSVPEDKTYYIK
jgi:hypothetical protein